MKESLLFEAKSIDVIFRSGSKLLSNEKTVHALKSVAFSMDNNESIGIIGESGSGKTTLVRALIGLQKVTNGLIHYKNRPLTEVLSKSRESFLKEVQIVFQDPRSSLNPKLSIQTQLDTPLRCLTKLTSKERQQRIQEVLEQVRLTPGALKRRPRAFSGGQAQRIAIARALLTRPKLIILDEAVSALDVSVQASILNLLKDLRDSYGVQFLFVGHDIATVEYLCPKLIVMKDGQIEEMGRREVILNNPKKEYTKSLINSIYR